MRVNIEKVRGGVGDISEREKCGEKEKEDKESGRGREK